MTMKTTKPTTDTEEILDLRRRLLKSDAALMFLAQRNLLSERVLTVWELGYIPRIRGYRKETRGRLAFPIRDAYGRLLSVQCRALFGQEPKYWHTPWEKGRHLYGLHVVKRKAWESKCLWIVEGQTDVIACWRAGIPAVGLSGTAISLWQIALAARYVPKVVFVADPDAAGERAAQRALAHAERLEYKVHAIYLSKGDPCKIWAKYGKDELVSVLQVERYVA